MRVRILLHHRLAALPAISGCPYSSYILLHHQRSSSLIQHSARLGSSAVAGLPSFCSLRFRSSTGGDDEDEEFEGLYFEGDIPKKQILQKWSEKNSKLAEISFRLDKANWIPPMLRQRMAQKYRQNMRNGEFCLSSLSTTSPSDNMKDCFDQLDQILRETSMDLIKKKLQTDGNVAAEELGRKERDERADKKKKSDKKGYRR